MSQASGDLPDQLVGLTAQDALVAISFRRVDRATVGVLRHAVRTGAQTIGISDHLSSPVARYSSISLVARLGTRGVARTITGLAAADPSESVRVAAENALRRMGRGPADVASPPLS